MEVTRISALYQLVLCGGGAKRFCGDCSHSPPPLARPFLPDIVAKYHLEENSPWPGGTGVRQPISIQTLFLGASDISLSLIIFTTFGLTFTARDDMHGHFFVC